MRQVAIVGLLAAGCGDDPTLKVIVEHEGFTVASTVVSVYESDAFSCERIEFGDAGPEELAAALVDEDHISAVDGVSEGLTGLSRVERKFIVARGYDAEGKFITAGCNFHDEIVGKDSVTVRAVPTASISVFNSGDDTDPIGLTVTVVDAHGNSIDERRVAWRVYGPDGTAPYVMDNIDMPVPDDAQWVPIDPTCSNSNGIVKLHPMPPSLIGGFATQVRTSWGTEPPRVFTAFTSVESFENFTLFVPPTDSRRWCAPRLKAGEYGLVCLDGAVARDYAVVVDAGTVRLTERPPAQTFGGLDLGERMIGVYSVERKDGAGAIVARDVYALSTKGRVLGTFSPTVTGANVPRLNVGEADDMLVVPACGADPQRLVLHVQEGVANTLAVMSTEGSPPMPYLGQLNLTTQPITLNQAGCMTELVPNQPTAQLRQVVVFDLGRSQNGMERITTTATFPCGATAGVCSINLPVPNSAVGFLPNTNRMVGAFFDASGTVLSEWVLQPNSDGESRLVELERITAASFPRHVVVGNFDGDTQPDLLWDLVNVNQNTANFQISYDRKVLDQRLTALSGAVQNTSVIDAFAADVDGDGHDDFVFTFEDKQRSRRGVTVVPFNVAPAPFVPKMEVKCQPKNAEMQ